MDKLDRNRPLVQSFLLQQYIHCLINKIHSNNWDIPTEEEKEECIDEFKKCTSYEEVGKVIIKVGNKFRFNIKDRM